MYDTILRYPWLAGINPDIRWPLGEWFYREADVPVKIAITNDFNFGEVSAAIILIVYLSLALDILESIGIYSVEIRDITLPPEYSDYSSVFSEEEVT